MTREYEQIQAASAGRHSQADRGLNQVSCLPALTPAASAGICGQTRRTPSRCHLHGHTGREDKHGAKLFVAGVCMCPAGHSPWYRWHVMHTAGQADRQTQASGVQHPALRVHLALPQWFPPAASVCRLGTDLPPLPAMPTPAMQQRCPPSLPTCAAVGIGGRRLLCQFLGLSQRGLHLGIHAGDVGDRQHCGAGKGVGGGGWRAGQAAVHGKQGGCRAAAPGAQQQGPPQRGAPQHASGPSIPHCAGTTGGRLGQQAQPGIKGTAAAGNGSSSNSSSSLSPHLT